ncbi:MAG: GNAT family N-acetyltransferase [Burkholderiales bacterium]
MIHILPATQDDIPALARVYVDTWRDQYAKVLPEKFLSRMTQADYENKWAGWLATPGTTTYIAYLDRHGVVGFSQGGPGRDGQLNFFSEIYLLYVLKDFQQQGIGRELTAAMANEFIKAGLWAMAVWCLRDNPSRGFYDAMGGELLAEKYVGVGGENFVEVAYGWRDARILVQHNKQTVLRRR